MGLIKSVCFVDNTNTGIKNTIEGLLPFLKYREWRFFRCTSSSELGIADDPNIGWNIDALKR